MLLKQWNCIVNMTSKLIYIHVTSVLLQLWYHKMITWSIKWLPNNHIAVDIDHLLHYKKIQLLSPSNQVRKPERNRPPRRIRVRQKLMLKMDLKETGYESVGWIHLALVNFQVPKNGGHFFISCMSVSFSRTVLLGICLLGPQFGLEILPSIWMKSH